MTKLVPILAIIALTALIPTHKAEAGWCFGGGWRCGPGVRIGIGVPLFAPAYYGRPYYGARPYYYSRGYSTSASVQAALADKGYYHGAIDGVIGPVSREAIRSYQASHRLPVTGSIDGPLLHSLRLG